MKKLDEKIKKLDQLVELTDLMINKLTLNPNYELSDEFKELLDEADLFINDTCNKVGLTLEELDKMSESDITRYLRKKKLNNIDKK